MRIVVRGTARVCSELVIGTAGQATSEARTELHSRRGSSSSSSSDTQAAAPSCPRTQSAKRRVLP